MLKLHSRKFIISFPANSIVPPKYSVLTLDGIALAKEFYTRGITGPFEIIVQGIATNDVIYGHTEFNVKKP